MQRLIALQLPHDLPQKGFGYRSGMRENPESHLGIVEYVLYRPPEGNDGALVVLPRP